MELRATSRITRARRGRRSAYAFKGALASAAVVALTQSACLSLIHICSGSRPARARGSGTCWSSDSCLGSRRGLSHEPVSYTHLDVYKRQEPSDHAIGRSRGGLTTKTHLVCDGRGRALAFVLTPGQAADTSMLIDTLSEIRVAGRIGRPRSRPDRVLADKGYPSTANRAWLRERDIATTIPERDDQIAHRRRKPGRPIDFGDEQKERYKGRNVVERCFNQLKQWRGIAMRSDKTARNYHAALCLAATLQWVRRRP